MGFLLVAIVSLTATKFAIAGEWDVYYSQFFGEDTVSLHLHGKGLANLREGILAKIMTMADSGGGTKEAMIVDLNGKSVYFINFLGSLCEKESFDEWFFYFIEGIVYKTIGKFTEIKLSEPLDSIMRNSIKIYKYRIEATIVRSDTDTIVYKGSLLAKSVRPEPTIEMDGKVFHPLWISDYPLVGEAFILCAYGSLRHELVHRGLAPIKLELDGFGKGNEHIFHMVLIQKYLDPFELTPHVKQILKSFNCSNSKE